MKNTYIHTTANEEDIDLICNELEEQLQDNKEEDEHTTVTAVATPTLDHDPIIMALV